MGQQCGGKLYNGDPCPRKVVVGAEWCIFHYPEKTGELVEQFKIAFEEEKRRQEEEHPDYLDFVGFDFPDDIEFEKEVPTVNFNKAVFRGTIAFVITEQSKFVFKGNAFFNDVTFNNFVGFIGATFKGDAFFEGTVLSSLVFFGEVTFEGDVLFFGATFKGPTRFSEVTFKKVAEFTKVTFGDVEFDGVIFEGKADFIKATCEENAVFNRTTFEVDVAFTEAVFKKDVWFTNTTFKGSTTFSRTIFEEDVGFNGVTFEGRMDITRVTFKGDTQFKLTTFSGGAQFSETTFNKMSIFTEVNFNSYTIFSKINFQGTSFFEKNNVSNMVELTLPIIEEYFSITNTQWRKPENGKSSMYRISEPMFKKSGKLVISGSLGTTQDFIAGISLIEAEQENIEFNTEKWPQFYGRKIIIDEILLEKGDTSITSDQVAQIYRRLRENYEKAKRYPEAGDFYKGEMEVTRKYRRGAEGRSEKRPCTDPTWWLYSIYLALSKYGESISRPLIWLFGSWFTMIILQRYYQQAWITGVDLSSAETVLLRTFFAFFPFSKPVTFADFVLYVFGSLLIGLTFIAFRRRLERR